MARQNKAPSAAASTDKDQFSGLLEKLILYLANPVANDYPEFLGIWMTNDVFESSMQARSEIVFTCIESLAIYKAWNGLQSLLLDMKNEDRDWISNLNQETIAKLTKIFMNILPTLAMENTEAEDLVVEILSKVPNNVLEILFPEPPVNNTGRLLKKMFEYS